LGAWRIGNFVQINRRLPDDLTLADDQFFELGHEPQHGATAAR